MKFFGDTVYDTIPKIILKNLQIRHIMQIRIILILISITLSLTNCMSYDFARRVVQQGNLLPKSKIERLHIGMSKDDVAILMGTSLISPMFNNNRWDYAYTWRKGNGKTRICSITLYFANNTLVKIDNASSSKH